MTIVDYLIYDDQPLVLGGKYAGVAPAYGSVTHYEQWHPSPLVGNGTRCSDCVWMVPNTISYYHAALL